MAIWVRDAGTWKASVQIWIRDGGSWKTANQIWIRDSATWKSASAGITVEITSSTVEEVGLGTDWRAKVTFSVGLGTSSVRVEVSVDQGAFSTIQTMNVTPGSTGNVTDYTEDLSEGAEVLFRLTPFSGADATGTEGDSDTLLLNGP